MHPGTHRSRAQDAIGFVVSALLLCVAAGWMPGRFISWRAPGLPPKIRSNNSLVKFSGTPASPAELATAVKLHHVYGHSLVPGGIHSIEELVALMLNDPLLADHYKSFNLPQTRFVVLDQDVPAYVSYRLDGKIYWSSHQTVIRKGELVITDGSSFIRARCGNRISYIPGFPTSAGEPTDMDIAQDLTPYDPPANAAEPPGPIAPSPLPLIPVAVPVVPWVPPLCCGAVPAPRKWPKGWPPGVSADEFSTAHFTILGHTVRISSELASLGSGILLILGLRSFLSRSRPKEPLR